MVGFQADRPRGLLRLHPHGAGEHALAAPRRLRAEVAAIDGDEFVALVVEAVPRQIDVGVRQRDALEFGIVEARRIGPSGRFAAEKPVAVRRIDAAGWNRGRGILRMGNGRGGGGSENERAAIQFGLLPAKVQNSSYWARSACATDASLGRSRGVHRSVPAVPQCSVSTSNAVPLGAGGDHGEYEEQPRYLRRW
jgi:hypothetical protein